MPPDIRIFRVLFRKLGAVAVKPSAIKIKAATEGEAIKRARRWLSHDMLMLDAEILSSKEMLGAARWAQ
jgi:hypothetical protein